MLLLLMVAAMKLEPESEESICEVSKNIVQGAMNYYLGNEYGGTVGMFSAPYYWWQAGEVFGGWIDYFHFCKPDNKTFEKILYDAMLHQAGSKFDYMPSNQSMTEGNDDQGVWGLTLLQAVERNFTDNKDNSWLSMAQSIYNQMLSRWDTTTCHGGLRWQIFTWNSGYNYKNSISNGCFFHIAARLYRYTDDERYLEQAEKIWDWMWGVGFMTDEDGEFIIYDGADDQTNCTDLTIHKWSYIYGVFLGGCAYLYNSTEDEIWKTRVEEILEASEYFYKDDVLQETTCEPWKMCNNDQRSFIALLVRNMGLTASLIPSLRDNIRNRMLRSSAIAAAQSCSGGEDGITCGQNWHENGWDGLYGLGEQMNALETVMTMITVDHEPYTADNGGSSKSVPDAGNHSTTSVNNNLFDVETKDKAGAAILTAVVLGLTLSGGVWMLF